MREVRLNALERRWKGWHMFRLRNFVTELNAWWRRLTPRWSGRVVDKVPSSGVGARAAQLNR
jgi:hypothetical protein